MCLSLASLCTVVPGLHGCGSAFGPSLFKIVLDMTVGFTWINCKHLYVETFCVLLCVISKKSSQVWLRRMLGERPGKDRTASTKGVTLQ